MEEKEDNKFLHKYGVLFFFAGVIIFFIILKLIGFPEILYN